MEARRDRIQGKLETLFEQERAFTRTGIPVVFLDYNGSNVSGGESERRRARVEECSSESSGRCSGMMEEEKWRFQAEMLRAECNLLRMERDIAVKKLERSRVKIEKTLRSSVQTLLSVSLSLSSCFVFIFVFFRILNYMDFVWLLGKCRKSIRKCKDNKIFKLSCLNFGAIVFKVRLPTNHLF